MKNTTTEPSLAFTLSYVWRLKGVKDRQSRTCSFHITTTCRALTTYPPFPTSPSPSNNTRCGVRWNDICRICPSHRDRHFKMATPNDSSSLCPNTHCRTSVLLTWCRHWMLIILRRQQWSNTESSNFLNSEASFRKSRAKLLSLTRS